MEFRTEISLVYPWFTLIKCQPRCRINMVKHPEWDKIVSKIGESPHPRHCEEVNGNREENEVGPCQDENVEDPESAFIQIVGIWAFVSITSSHHRSHFRQRWLLQGTLNFWQARIAVCKLKRVWRNLMLRFESHIRSMSSRSTKFFTTSKQFKLAQTSYTISLDKMFMLLFAVVLKVI